MNEEELIEDGELLATAEPITTEELDAGVLEAQPNQVQPTGGKFPSAFGAKYGNSSVDLSVQDNEDKMLDEYNTWFRMGQSDERDKLREDFNSKYYNMSTEQLREQNSQPNALEVFDGYTGEAMRGMAAMGTGGVDFITDAIGTLVPGGNKFDDWWDANTKFDNPAHQQIRKISSILLPAIVGGNLSTAAASRYFPQAARFSTGWFKRMGAMLAANGITDTAIVGLSDTSEEATALTTLAEVAPKAFGPKGVLPIPEIFKTKDSDSPGIRKARTMLENGPLLILGNVLGAFVDVKNGNKTMGWMEPLDETAAQYKQTQLKLGGDNDKLIRLAEIDEVLALNTGKKKVIGSQTERALIDEKLRIENELGIIDTIDDVQRRSDATVAIETNAAATAKKLDIEQLELDLGIDPDISPNLFDDAEKARTVPNAGNVARNMADSTAIKQGTSKGDPAPVITDSMLNKGLMVGPKSRGAVMGVAEAGRDAGRFNALVDGVRITAKEMNAAAWGIYHDIVDPLSTVDDVKNLFLENRDVKNLLMGKFKIEVINEEQARAAAFAMRELVDRFLGRDVTKASARAMDSIGREAASIAEAVSELSPVIDENRAMDNILDKLYFLMDEYALNKYISGWQLRNKNWFDQVPPSNVDEAIETLLTEFKQAENSIHARNKRFTKELKKLKKTNPEALRPLVDAFAHTNGDVDSLAKLYKWAASQITPIGLVKSPDPKSMNLFARGAWAVRYNNVLSGLSAFRAAVGNGAQLVLKPITSLLGHGFYGYQDGFEGFKRTLFYNGAVFETNRRALHDAFEMMKKAHKDPATMIKAYRKDFVFKTDKTWEIMEGMRPLYEKEGNIGKLIQLDMSIGLKQMGAHPALRYGMTAMVFPDQFTGVHLAHYYSRMKAYDDVFSDKGFADWTEILKAEKQHYDKMFDADGLIRDDVVRQFAGEVQLNLDDGVANYVNQATTAYPILKDFMMFPRTASNYMKVAASYTPISLIPGISKYSKTIYAKTDEEIAEALLEHGINMANTPQARVIWENLRAEYTGRLIFSGMLVSSLQSYAMSGGIRGNGHYNASRRNKERTQMGYEPKTIRMPIPGTDNDVYVSYKGIPGVEQVLAMMGDVAYYANDMDESFLQSLQAKLSWTIAATFLNETPLQGLEPLIAFINGDMSGLYRKVGQSTFSLIPSSATIGVINKAIDSTLKDIATDDVGGYIKSRIPFLSSTMPEQIDIWTGKPVNDIDNPFLRTLNALSPMGVSGTNEPWREQLRQIGYNGLSMLKKDSTGSYEYEPQERELIYKYIGEQQMWRQLERIFKSKKFQDDIAVLREHRKGGKNSELITLDTEDLPIFNAINNVVKNAQKIAEIKLLREQPNIANVILHQQNANFLMKQGDVKGAIGVSNKVQATENLLNMRK